MDTKYFTVVYKDVQPGDEPRAIGAHPKAVAFSWSHAINEVHRLEDERKPVELTPAQQHADELLKVLMNAAATASLWGVVNLVEMDAAIARATNQGEQK
jgi:hypothetical protein